MSADTDCGDPGFSVDYDDDYIPRGRIPEGRDYPDGTILHFSERCHFKEPYLEKTRLKRTLQRIIVEYARIFECEILNYSIMDNHFHLIVRLRPQSGRAKKMVGLIKQRFTHKFKAWYNCVWRRQKKHRIPKLPNGTLWEGRCDPKVVCDAHYLVNCVLYVENNRLKAVEKKTIEALSEPPDITELAGEDWMICVDNIEDTVYGELLEVVRRWRFHSAGYWLDPYEVVDPVLSDGTDGRWASQEEADEVRWVPVDELPEGWRKVYVDDTYRLLKDTPEDERSLPDHPLWQALGRCPTSRSERFFGLMAWAVWRQRCTKGHGPAVVPKGPTEDLLVGVTLKPD